MTFELRVLSDADLRWSWAGGSNQDQPGFAVGAGTYPRTVNVRPRPAYPHTIEIVQETLDRCQEHSPLTGSPGQLCVLDRDFVDGFNGIATYDPVYRRPDGSDWDVSIPDAFKEGKSLKLNGQALLIVLAGKAVPQHPSWTRYLVGHEYGHCAWYHATRLLGWGTGEREREYMRVRGFDDWRDGRRWHQLAGEIIANDWRVLAGIEPDFWQHDVPRPTGAIVEWWERARELSKRGLDGDNHELVKSTAAATSSEA